MSQQTQAGIDYSKVDEIISACGAEKSHLIAILQKVQEEFRYLPLDIMTYIGTKIEGLSPATVYGVATFYAQFSLEPKGKYENAHTWPVEEPLHELAKSCEVVIVGCKPEEISSPDVVMGLSDSVEAAIPKAIDIILKEIGVL